MMPDAEFETSDRGLRYYAPIPTTYGHAVSVYESSSARSPHLWLDVDLTLDGAEGAQSNIDPESATAHMTVDQAEALILTLRAAIDGHYQTRDDLPEVEGSNGAWLPGTQGPDRVSPQECVRTARDALSRAYASTEPPWQFIAEALDWQRRAVEQMIPPESP